MFYAKVSCRYYEELTLEICPSILVNPCVITDKLCNISKLHISGALLKSNTPLLSYSYFIKIKAVLNYIFYSTQQLYINVEIRYPYS
jgi:hypothetical protein